MFTFKKEPYPGGLMGITFKNTTHVKYKGRLCGVIKQTDQPLVYLVRLQVQKTESDPVDNCTWKWVQFKARGTEPEMRVWLNSNFESITSKYTLYCH